MQCKSEGQQLNICYPAGLVYKPERAFGTIKAWMGATHFLTRTRAKVAAEMSLHVLAYNFKRVLKIIGIGPLMAAIKAI